jgi:hypothetical protein
VTSFAKDLPSDPRPPWFAAWIAYCRRQITGALTAGLRMPTQRNLERRFGDFMAEQQNDKGADQ